MMSRDNSPTLMAGYLDTLSKLRTKFNQIKNQGDAGPEVKKLMGQTLDGGTSELADALRFVDEQMLVGMTETAKTTLRPLLVRPLIQSFSVMVKPVETEVNRIWLAQVHEIFMRTLSDKYPFSPASKVEASPSEIAKILGPDGAISKFSVDTLGPLIVRRGDTLVARTWADIGIAFTPDFTSGFSAWVAPLDGSASSAQSGSVEGAAAQRTVFQVLPLGAPGLMEYSLEIDGQVMRYRNTAAAWTNFFWPNSAGVPGVKIAGVTNDGRSVDILNEPGRFGLDRMFSVASKKSMPDGSTELSWSKDGATVAVQLRIISQPGATAASKEGAAQAPKSSGLQGLRLPALIASSDIPPSGQTASANVAVAAHGTP
jgi:type VI secretion system protein ImpL